MPAERLKEVVSKRLEDFGLDLKKDIISVVSDGAAVMRKFGRLLPCSQQLCLAHGLQLAISDVLYKKR